jgi:hypothetical protein
VFRRLLILNALTRAASAMALVAFARALVAAAHAAPWVGGLPMGLEGIALLGVGTLPLDRPAWSGAWATAPGIAALAAGAAVVAHGAPLVGGAAFWVLLGAQSIWRSHHRAWVQATVGTPAAWSAVSTWQFPGTVAGFLLGGLLPLAAGWAVVTVIAALAAVGTRGALPPASTAPEGPPSRLSPAAWRPLRPLLALNLLLVAALGIVDGLAPTLPVRLWDAPAAAYAALAGLLAAGSWGGGLLLTAALHRHPTWQRGGAAGGAALTGLALVSVALLPRGVGLAVAWILAGVGQAGFAAPYAAWAAARLPAAVRRQALAQRRAWLTVTSSVTALAAGALATAVGERVLLVVAGACLLAAGGLTAVVAWDRVPSPAPASTA